MDEVRKKLQSMPRPRGKTFDEMNDEERAQHIRYAFTLLAEAYKPFGLYRDIDGSVVALNLENIEDNPEVAAPINRPI